MAAVRPFFQDAEGEFRARSASEQTAGFFTLLEERLSLPFKTEVPRMEVTVARLNMTDDEAKDGGAEGIRTPDPHNAIVVLYQLSYDPIRSARRVLKPDCVCQNVISSTESSKISIFRAETLNAERRTCSVGFVSFGIGTES